MSKSLIFTAKKGRLRSTDKMMRSLWMPTQLSVDQLINQDISMDKCWFAS